MRAVRQRLVNGCWWGIAHAADIHYPPGDIRTQPIAVVLAEWKNHSLPIDADCSEAVDGVFFRADAPDPTGTNWGETGPVFTGTMLDNLQVITAAQARPGDLIVFGGGTGDHVVIILETGEDPLLFSHGSEAGPLEIRLSAETQFHQGQPITYLRGVPKMARKPGKRRYTVSGNTGGVISHAVGVKRWLLRHHKLQRQNREHLHFDHLVEHPQDAHNPPTHTEEPS
jgi:hypothetical protein